LFKFDLCVPRASVLYVCFSSASHTHGLGLLMQPHRWWPAGALPTPLNTRWWPCGAVPPKPGPSPEVASSSSSLTSSPPTSSPSMELAQLPASHKKRTQSLRPTEFICQHGTSTSLGRRVSAAAAAAAGGLSVTTGRWATPPTTEVAARIDWLARLIKEDDNSRFGDEAEVVAGHGGPQSQIGVLAEESGVAMVSASAAPRPRSLRRSGRWSGPCRSEGRHSSASSRRVRQAVSASGDDAVRAVPSAPALFPLALAAGPTKAAGTPSGACWDWPLSRLERKARVLMIDRQVMLIDRQELVNKLERLEDGSRGAASEAATPEVADAPRDRGRSSRRSAAF